MKTDHAIALAARLRDKAYEFIVRELKHRKITGLAPSHGGIMSTLFARGRAPMKDLAQGIGRDKSTVTALVRKLARAGYVLKEKDEGDARVTHLRLTARGRLLEKDFAEISARMLAAVFRGFSRREREAAVRFLARMLDNLSDR